MEAPVIVDKDGVPSTLQPNNSVKSSPIHITNRKNSYSNSSSCSSQVNNNYSGLDMESLDDMLRKVNFVFFCLSYGLHTQLPDVYL